MPLLAAASVLLLAYTAAADSALRCKGRLAVIGDSRDAVRKVCGDPDDVVQWEEAPGRHLSQIFDYETERYRLPRAIDGPVEMERWVYDFGPHRFRRFLIFQNGELIRIETGKKGR